MAYPQGINFRDTLGYVTDGANESMATANNFGPAYPVTTTQGNTVGWEGALGNTRDRTTSNDRRLAGIHFTAAIQTDFRFDLPAAGSYNIRLAAGDAGGVNSTDWTLIDGTTSLGQLCSGNNGAANSFRDATNAVYTAAAWPGSNTAVAKTFATTICRFRSSAAAGNDAIAHAYVEAASGSPDVTLALSGQGVTASRGTLLSGASKAIAGQSATASTGAVVASRALAVTGQSATAARGTVSPALSVGMTGQSAQALRGNVSVSGTADVTVALSGQTLTASRGSLVPSAAKALIGQAQSAQQGLLTPARAIVISGQSSTVQRGSVSPSNNVTVALVGQAITATQGSMAAFAASAAKFNQSTIMRATITNRSSAARATSIAASSAMRSSFSQSTVMRINPLNATATMSDAAINRTANLL